MLAALLLGFGSVVPLAAAGVFTRFAEPAVHAGGERQKKGSHEHDFLLLGTVFTEQGFALPGAAIRVRRAGESKVRWEGRSDRRGEFALRIPQGAEYELSVTASGYREQTRKINAKTGDREDLVFRLTPAQGGKKQ